MPPRPYRNPETDRTERAPEEARTCINRVLQRPLGRSLILSGKPRPSQTKDTQTDTDPLFQTGDFGAGRNDMDNTGPTGNPTRQDQVGHSITQTYGYGKDVSAHRNRDYAAPDRGLMTRAADEVAAWFGNQDAARRREADHRGKGPKGYTRSDARIHEDVCDALSDDAELDASTIEVRVAGGAVTLSGTADSKQAKRRAEDCADSVSGVRNVQNNLRLAVTPVLKSSSSTESATSGGDGSSETSDI